MSAQRRDGVSTGAGGPPAPPVSEPTIAPVATPATSTEATVPEPSRR